MVFKERRNSKTKNKHSKPWQTYFELIEVICAVLSGQTLHYAGHW